MCDSILILDKIDSNKSHVYYSPNTKQRELKYSSNISFFQDVKRLFTKKKNYIEDLEADIEEGQRLSEDFTAHLINIDSFEYKKLLQEAATHHKKLIDEAAKFYEESSSSVLSEEKLKVLNEFGDFLHFISMYRDLVSKDEYKDYSYYFYTEN